MTKPRDPWWKSAQVIVSLLVLLFGVGGSIWNSIASAERNKVAVERVKEDVEELQEQAADEEDVKELEARVAEEEEATEDYKVQQQLIQQDIGYIKEAQKEILNALKKR